jgi:hypothetical protein
MPSRLAASALVPAEAMICLSPRHILPQRTRQVEERDREHLRHGDQAAHGVPQLTNIPRPGRPLELPDDRLIQRRIRASELRWLDACGIRTGPPDPAT